MWSVQGTVLAVCVGLLWIIDAEVASASPTGFSKRADLQSAYDFIIVGGGTAGLTLAARLTESGTQSVLVLEAGPEPTILPAYSVPGGSQSTLGSELDWAFVTPPLPTLMNRTITYHRGRGLGGSSIINGLAYGRGSESIYDLWQSLGNANWDWNNVFPFFQKSTTFNPPAAELQFEGHDPNDYSNGPVQLTFAEFAPNSTLGFVEALGSIGVEPVQDLNGGVNIGATQELLTVNSSQARSSAYDSYYMQANGRPNLTVRTLATVQLIIVNDTMAATGVVFSNQSGGGATVNVTANKEVIVSAGAFQTPQILMLSGIGPADTLAENGISLLVDNPNIGQNLQDHLYFSVNVRTQASASLQYLDNDISALQAAEVEYQQNKSGPLTSPGGTTFGFQQLSVAELQDLGATELISNRANQSHIEYLFEPFFYPNMPTPEYAPLDNESYVSLTAAIIAPVSRGSVTLRSKNINDSPVINLNYLNATTDQALAIQAFKNLRTILANQSIQQFVIGPNLGEVSPGPSVQTDAEILAYIQETCIPVWHVSGSCAMLPQNQGGVVNDLLQVYGVSGLRVVDTSIFPIIMDQHTQGPVYMVAEKAAQMIRDTYGF